MRYVGWLLLLVTFVAYSSNSAATIQCTCPSIAAEAKGNSSCSATETGSRCTIDFNRFPDFLESKAAEDLSKALDEGVNFPPEGVDKSFAESEESAAVLSEAIRVATESKNDDGFNQLLLIYLTIAVASRTDAENVYKGNADFFSDLRNVVSAQSASLQNAFKIPDAVPAIEGVVVGRAEYGKVSLIFTPGCVEARSGEIWVMYKTYWASAARLPRCGAD
jgi:hypothetical protein